MQHLKKKNIGTASITILIKPQKAIAGLKVYRLKLYDKGTQSYVCATKACRLMLVLPMPIGVGL